MNRSINSVNSALELIGRKLGVSGRVAIVVKAHQVGLVDLDDIVIE